MKTIQSKDAFLEVIQQPGIHVFLFTTKWCGDCIYIKPFLPNIVSKFEELNFYEIDRDQCMDLARELEIMGIPSFVAFKDGKQISRFVSSLRKTQAEIEVYLTETIEKGA